MNKMCKEVGLVLIVALVCVEFAYGGLEGDALATFYGNKDGKGTAFGACGYDVFDQGYGLATAAVSSPIFKKGARCGACFRIMCINYYSDRDNCSQTGTPIFVTATNFCPPSYKKAGGHWCQKGWTHFALSEPMFRKLASPKAELLNVRYEQVPCRRKGGMKFQLKGNPHWTLVLVYNVGGAGDVVDVKVKGSKTRWIKMKRIWGQNWETFTKLHGQSLSFQVTTSDGNTVVSDNVAPANWQFGQSFEGRNF